MKKKNNDYLVEIENFYKMLKLRPDDFRESKSSCIDQKGNFIYPNESRNNSKNNVQFFSSNQIKK